MRREHDELEDLEDGFPSLGMALAIAAGLRVVSLLACFLGVLLLGLWILS